MTITNPRAWQEAEGYLRRAQRILAITHVQPDGDAVGSLMGFTHAMRGLGKQVTPACQDEPNQRFDYLNGVRDVTRDVSRDVTRLGEGEFDLIVALDASDLGRLGSVFLPVQHASIPIVVFDHHITNTQFGAVNVVEPAYSSTAELVLMLTRRMNIPLTPDIAVALLTGVITDSLAFRTSNTTPDTLAAAIELMQAGAPLVEITRKALTLRSFDSLKMLGMGLNAAQLDGRVAYALLTRKLRKEMGIREDRGDAGLVGTLITAQEADVAAVFVELPDGNIEIGLRSQPGFDISQVALELGGGGHAAAAGCTLPGPMRDAVSRVLPRLRQVVRGA
jgi:phosphoesterase RecJ-like protein